MVLSITWAILYPTDVPIQLFIHFHIMLFREHLLQARARAV